MDLSKLKKRSKQEISKDGVVKTKKGRPRKYSNRVRWAISLDSTIKQKVLIDLDRLGVTASQHIKYLFELVDLADFNDREEYLEFMNANKTF